MKKLFVYIGKLYWIFFLLFIIFFDKAYTFVNTVELTLEAEVTIHNQQEDPVSEIFYSTKSEYSEDRKASFSYKNYKKGTIYPLTISIPNAYRVGGIRLDPVYNGTCVFTIHQMVLRRGLSHRNLSLDKLYHANNISGRNAIKSIQFEKEKINIYTNGEDPYLQIITNLSSFTGTKPRIFYPLIISVVLGFVCSLILRFILEKTGVLRGVNFLFEINNPTFAQPVKTKHTHHVFIPSSGNYFYKNIYIPRCIVSI